VDVDMIAMSDIIVTRLQALLRDENEQAPITHDIAPFALRKRESTVNRP
jgi:ubiquitin-protein ligase